MKTLESGLVAGTLATSPMTYFMFFTQQEIPKEEHAPLPPAILSNQMMNPRTTVNRQRVTLLAHFGFGAAMGAMYSALQKYFPHSRLKGAAFGLLVWSASYLGWIPILKLKPSAKNLSPARNAMMIAAHIVWGMALASAFDRLRYEGVDLLDAKRT